MHRIVSLLRSRRFLPICITQFLGAFNDNFFKTAMLMLVTYTLVSSETGTAVLNGVGAGIFILPFFIFSAFAGQLADKFDKAILIRILKSIEIVAMSLAAVGFLFKSIVILFITLFFMGTHSAFFGPAKYSILPDHMKKEELISANAIVEATTFLAILFGTIIGGSFIKLESGIPIVSTLGVFVALAGLTSSLFIPNTKRAHPDLTISYNIFQQTFAIMKHAKENRNVFLAILGISWLWAIGSVILTCIIPYTKDVLLANPIVATLLLAMFSIGIGIGSFVADRLQKGRINAQFVPMAVLGMSIFLIDAFFASPSSSATHTASLMSVGAFLQTFMGWRILIDMLLMSVFGGMYIVPLYAMIQSLAKDSHRSRVIAANNVINAMAMVGAIVIYTLLVAVGVTIPAIYLLIGILNLGVAVYICKLLPDSMIKSILQTVLTFFFRVKVTGLDNYDKSGKKTIIVANHVSFLDAVLLAAFLPDKAIFAINAAIADKWWIKPILRLYKAFPMDPMHPMATKTLIKEVNNNQRCIIFPEGRLTVTGTLMKIYESPGLIADKTGANILPIRIDGAQYSPFSRLKDKERVRLFPKITINILEPRKFEIDSHIQGRQRRRLVSAKLYDVMSDMMFESSGYQQPLYPTLVNSAKVKGRGFKIIEDLNRKPMNYGQLLGRSFILGRYIAKHTEYGENVGVLLPTVNTFVVTFFALHAFGRIPAMLNFSTGSKNILLACKTAQIKTIYTSSQFVKTAKLEQQIKDLKAAGLNVVMLESLRKVIKLHHKLIGLFMGRFPSHYYHKFNPKAHYEDTSVILFTSGSEGAPKGVVLSHANLQANRYQLTSRVDFNPQDLMFNSLPVFHTFGLSTGTILPVLTGVRVFLYPSPLHYRIVPELVYDTNATMMFGTDTFLTGYARCAHPYDFYSIRYIFAGAEKLKEETRRTWDDKFGVRLFEGYGATETSPVVSTNTAMQNKPGTVGRPMPKVQCRLEPVPGIDEGGRLFVKGPNIMKGYMFADNPGVLVEPKDGWYDTGDIVSIDEEGYLSILGRAKRFAKIGGEMVSLSAVENHVGSLWPDSLHCVVNAPDPKKGEMLILVTDKPNATREELIEYFKKEGIGEIYFPKKLIHVEEMFILGAGKVDFSKAKEYVMDLMKADNATNEKDSKVPAS